MTTLTKVLVEKMNGYQKETKKRNRRKFQAEIKKMIKKLEALPNSEQQRPIMEYTHNFDGSESRNELIIPFDKDNKSLKVEEFLRANSPLISDLEREDREIDEIIKRLSK